MNFIGILSTTLSNKSWKMKGCLSKEFPISLSMYRGSVRIC